MGCPKKNTRGRQKDKLDVDQNRRRRGKEELLLVYEFENEEASVKAGRVILQVLCMILDICSSMSAVTDSSLPLGQIVTCSS